MISLYLLIKINICSISGFVLRNAGKPNPLKCVFAVASGMLLGHIISKDGIYMDPSKLDIINGWPIPKNLHELQSFTRMCTYYGRFIESFLLIVGPLHDLTKKNVKYC